MSSSIHILDTTLRDGAQAPGVQFSLADRVAIACALDEAGVAEIEAGTPAIGPDEVAAIQEVGASVSRIALSCWCRMVREDVDQAADCGTDILHLSVPCSDVLLASWNKDRSWVQHRIEELVPYAASTGCQVSVGFQDASRADRVVVCEMARLAADAGAFRIRIADTVGILTPLQAYRLMAAVRLEVPEVDLDMHCHNDLGMATANTLMGVQAGANTVNVTVNGLGERAGNAPLEEVVAGLEMGSGIPTRVDMARLCSLSALVAARSGRPVVPAKPVVGSGAFAHISGLHVLALGRNPASYEPFPPESVGHADRSLLYGRLSGRGAIRTVLERNGMALEGQAISTLLTRIGGQEAATGAPLTEQEVLSLVSSREGEPVPIESEQQVHV